MLTALDCYYSGSCVTAAACAVNGPADPLSAETFSIRGSTASDYEPGAFYRRELPPLMALLDRIQWHSSVLIIDGYVDLAEDRPGLGRHLYHAIHAATPVIGAAKNPFSGNRVALPVLRGASKKPLFVTAAGMSAVEAAELIRVLHGEYRVPTLLKAVDALSRQNDPFSPLVPLPPPEEG